MSLFGVGFMSTGEASQPDERDLLMCVRMLWIAMGGLVCV